MNGGLHRWNTDRLICWYCYRFSVMVAGCVVFLADEKVEKLVVCLVTRMIDGLGYW